MHEFTKFAVQLLVCKAVYEDFQLIIYEIHNETLHNMQHSAMQSSKFVLEKFCLSSETFFSLEFNRKYIKHVNVWGGRLGVHNLLSFYFIHVGDGFDMLKCWSWV